MATLATYRNVIARKIGLTNSGDEQTLIDEWVNQGATDFMLQTKCRVISDDVSLTAGTGDYELDTDILVMRRVTCEDSAGEEFNLVQVTPSELLRMRRAGSSAAGSPVYRYAVDGANLLMVYPTPTATDVLTVYYVPRPATLSAAGDSPTEIPTEFHKAVEYFALAEAADFKDDQTSSQGDRYRGLYLAEVRKAKTNRLVKGGARLPSAYLGRRRWVRHREDVYP